MAAAPATAVSIPSDLRTANQGSGFQLGVRFTGCEGHSLFPTTIGCSFDRLELASGGESGGINAPREYWKVVAYVDDRDNKERVFGFLITQASLIGGLVVPEGIDFDAWLWARITLQDLREKTASPFLRQSGIARFRLWLRRPWALPCRLGRSSSPRTISRAEGARPKERLNAVAIRHVSPQMNP